MVDPKHTIFISHASQDLHLAQVLCEALENRGIRCWLAGRDVTGGDNFQSAIPAAIRASKAMILIFTNNANNSDEIKKELALASQHRLTVIPLRAEEVVPEPAFEYELSTRQWIDMFDNWEDSLQRVVGQISSIAEGGASIQKDPALKSSDRTRGRVSFFGIRPLSLALIVAMAAIIITTSVIVLYQIKIQAQPVIVQVSPPGPRLVKADYDRGVTTGAADVHASPTLESAIIRHIEPTQELNVIGLAIVGNKTWTMVRSIGSSDGYLPPDAPFLPWPEWARSQTISGQINNIIDRYTLMVNGHAVALFGVQAPSSVPPAIRSQFERAFDEVKANLLGQPVVCTPKALRKFDCINDKNTHIAYWYLYNGAAVVDADSDQYYLKQQTLAQARKVGLWAPP
jgi:endonuclease YncB( thermonuclease family)